LHQEMPSYFILISSPLWLFCNTGKLLGFQTTHQSNL
jgi:hypothetical protein